MYKWLRTNYLKNKESRETRDDILKCFSDLFEKLGKPEGMGFFDTTEFYDEYSVHYISIPAYYLDDVRSLCEVYKFSINSPPPKNRKVRFLSGSDKAYPNHF